MDISYPSVWQALAISFAQHTADYLHLLLLRLVCDCLRASKTLIGEFLQAVRKKVFVHRIEVGIQGVPHKGS